MAEKLSIEQILNELFNEQKKTKKKGGVEKKQAALVKFNKVLVVRQELSYYFEYDMPLSDVAPGAVYYFCERFLGGKSFFEASEDEKRAGYTKLDYAVSSCHNRCFKLFYQLNEALIDKGLEPIMARDKSYDRLSYEERSKIRKDTLLMSGGSSSIDEIELPKSGPLSNTDCMYLGIENLLYYLTFDHYQGKDGLGKPLFEKPYGAPVLVFTCKEHFDFFRKEINKYLKKGMMVSMRKIRIDYNLSKEERGYRDKLKVVQDRRKQIIESAKPI